MIATAGIKCLFTRDHPVFGLQQNNKFDFKIQS